MENPGTSHWMGACMSQRHDANARQQEIAIHMKWVYYETMIMHEPEHQLVSSPKVIWSVSATNQQPRRTRSALKQGACELQFRDAMRNTGTRRDTKRADCPCSEFTRETMRHKKFILRLLAAQTYTPRSQIRYTALVWYRFGCEYVPILWKIRLALRVCKLFGTLR